MNDFGRRFLATHAIFFASRVTRHASQFVATVALAALSACATAPKPAALHAPTALHHWQANGRIAVSGAQDGGSGSFTWVQNGADADVRMHGPIGIGHLHLTLSDADVSIETGDGERYGADAAKMELAERLGADVPAGDLRYWLVGLAAPGEHEWVQQEDDTATLLQHDWRIDYRFGAASGLKLPTRLVAVSGPAKVRIIVDRWSGIR